MVDALVALDRARDGRSRSRYPIGSGDPAVLRTERARHAARRAQGRLAGPIDILPPGQTPEATVSGLEGEDPAQGFGARLPPHQARRPRPCQSARPHGGRPLTEELT